MKPNGSVSYLMHCPVPNCPDMIKVTHKAYHSSYKKKRVDSTNSLTAARWHVANVKQHLQKHICRPGRQGTESDNVSSDDELIENHYSASSNSNNRVDDRQSTHIEGINFYNKITL